jgi:hypothetical protein
MERFDVKMDSLRTEPSNATTIRPYEPPSIRVMDEAEVLSAFQVTVAGVTWWVM